MQGTSDCLGLLGKIATLVSRDSRYSSMRRALPGVTRRTRTGVLRLPYRSFGKPQIRHDLNKRARRPHFLQMVSSRAYGEVVCLKDSSHIPRCCASSLRGFSKIPVLVRRRRWSQDVRVYEYSTRLRVRITSTPVMVNFIYQQGRLQGVQDRG